MAQFARPAEDILIDNWQTESGGGANLYQQIDESVANDSDFIQSQLTPTSDVYVAKLSSVVDPVSSSGHTLRYRYGKSASAGDQIDLTVQLRQGYVNEGNQGTLIAQDVLTNVGGFPLAGSHALSGAEADAITNYGDLYIRIVANKP